MVLKASEARQRFGLNEITLARLAQRHPEIKVGHGLYDEAKLAALMERLRRSITAEEACRAMGISRPHLAVLARRYPLLRVEHNRYDPLIIEEIRAAAGERRYYGYGPNELTASEALKLLGISRKRLSQLAKHYPEIRLGRNRYSRPAILELAAMRRQARSHRNHDKEGNYEETSTRVLGRDELR